MGYEVNIDLETLEEIDAQGTYYQERVSSGREDFLHAVDGTISKIGAYPHIGNIRLATPSIRSMSIHANPERKQYAKSFPFSLIYTIDESEYCVYIYQLWPEQSSIPINPPE